MDWGTAETAANAAANAAAKCGTDQPTGDVVPDQCGTDQLAFADADDAVPDRGLPA